MKNIQMNTEMAKAILDGRKLQTRIVIKDNDFIDIFLKNGGELNKLIAVGRLSKYQKGEVIWVREPAEVTSMNAERMTIDYHYGADEWIVNEANKMFIPERFIDMDRTNEIVENFDLIKPKWIKECQGIPYGCIKEMARIFLKITDVRVERLHGISIEDIGKEGSHMDTKYAEDIGEDDFCYEWGIDTWDETAPKGYQWSDNPYVFVYEFERVKNDN